ncbi:MAG: carbohydrate ABC transporter permease [Clostridiales bacterium]|nr:carbohydrate ABC transporter permease [Clostridiales bacterium]
MADTRGHIRVNTGDRIFDAIVLVLMTIFLLICLYPLYFILIASISDPNLVATGNVILYPRGITFSAYERIFAYRKIWSGYRNTIIYTSLGTTINVVITVAAGFALSRKTMVGRRFFLMLFVFTMFFNGGMIPTYMVVKELGLINTIWAMVLPNAMQVWNLMIARSFFETTIPEDLRSAAFIDGAGNLRFFFQIVLPLSKAVVSVMVLFYAISHWNAFFNAYIYLESDHLYPLQVVLRDILVSNQPDPTMIDDIATLIEKQKVAELLKYGLIVVASLPVLMLYPFVQRYFVTGVMVGSIKG